MSLTADAVAFENALHDYAFGLVSERIRFGEPLSELTDEDVCEFITSDLHSTRFDGFDWERLPAALGGADPTEYALVCVATLASLARRYYSAN